LDAWFKNTRRQLTAPGVVSGAVSVEIPPEVATWRLLCDDAFIEQWRAALRGPGAD
jgi:hypothetical protein